MFRLIFLVAILAQASATLECKGNTYLDNECAAPTTPAPGKGTWKKTAAVCTPKVCGLAKSDKADTYSCYMGDTKQSDEKKCTDTKPTSKTACAATAACTWKKTAATCPSNKVCGLAETKPADTHKCINQLDGDKALDDSKCTNKPTATTTTCAATDACTWKKTAATCTPKVCGLAKGTPADTYKCTNQLDANKELADGKCPTKPSTVSACVATAACTWKKTAGTCPTKCGTAKSDVADTQKCINQLDLNKELADGKCPTKPSTKTACAATAACLVTTTAKPCAKTNFIDTVDSKCKACPEGYTCDGTKAVTKTKKVCAKAEKTTAKCLKCPTGHTCKDGVAKADGKAFTTAPPKKEEKKEEEKKESKLSNSNTLSVALPLCLTALIMFK